MISTSRISRKSIWVVVAILAMLSGCAIDPHYKSAPMSPTSVSPDDDVDIFTNARTTFTWLPTKNTQYYDFHIYNQKTKDTTQYRHDQILKERICNESRCSLTLNVDLPTSVGHAWRVRAGNNAGLSEWNRTRFNMINTSTEPSASAKSSTESGANADQAEGTQRSASEMVSTGGAAVKDLVAIPTLEVSASPAAVKDLVAIQTLEVSTGSAVVQDLKAIPTVEVRTGGAAVKDFHKIPAVEVMATVEEVYEDGTSTQASDNKEDAELSASLEPVSITDGPYLMQPVEGRRFATGSLIDFEWRSLPDAVSYDFYIYDSVSKKMIESLTDIAAETLCRGENVCALIREISLPEADHLWRVRANFENGTSPFSSNRFVVVR